MPPILTPKRLRRGKEAMASNLTGKTQFKNAYYLTLIILFEQIFSICECPRSQRI